ncbi:MAG: hypothetical protein VCB25_10055 [Myxococcota bacterium]
MVSRDEAGLRQGLTDNLAARVTDPEGAGFREYELAVLRALPLMRAETAEDALGLLRPNFEAGEIGQIVHAYGMYRGIHATLTVLGAEILDAEGRPLSERRGFGAVTRVDGSMVPRDEAEWA